MAQFNSQSDYETQAAAMVAAAAGKAPPVSQSGRHLSEVTLTNGANVVPERIDWLWYGFIAVGKIQIMAGPAGVSKTTLVLAMAATVTTGGQWPDGSRAGVGDVLIWTGEDGIEDTLVPRLMAAGADMRRIHFVTGAVDADGKARSFDPSTDIQALQRAAAGKNITLMIVDPIVSAVAGDSHKNTEVRRALQPLVDFAAQAKCSILGITHYSKGSQGADPTDRVIGSVAFGAVARVVFACVKQGNSDDGSDPHSRLFVRSKSNIGPDGGGFRYTLEQVEVKGYPGLWASRILWGEELEGNAREILSKAEAVEMDNKGNSDIEECKQFLLDTLSGGAVCAKLIREEADQAGHSWKLVDRVSRELGIIKKKEGFKSGWTWDMPPKNPKNPEYPDKKKQDSSDSSGDDSALIATKSATGIFEVTL